MFYNTTNLNRGELNGSKVKAISQEGRVLEYLKDRTGSWFTTDEIQTALCLHPDSAGRAINTIMHRTINDLIGRVKKSDKADGISLAGKRCYTWSYVLNNPTEPKQLEINFGNYEKL